MNQEVCKQCYRQYPKSWDANQDIDWSAGYVVCPVRSTPDWWKMRGMRQSLWTMPHLLSDV